jgi:alkaline phosphatase D
MLTRREFATGVAALLLPAGAWAQQPRLITRIAFGSCAAQERPQPIWAAVRAYRPHLFIFAGDNVYGDYRDGKEVPREEQLDGLRHAYALAARIPGLTALRDNVLHLAVWDDHDYGRNDAGAELEFKRESQQLFLDFWKVPADDPRRTREGVYHAQIFGLPDQRVQVILLDTRYFRSALKPTDQRDAPGRERFLPDDDPAKTMLGDAQWAWLAEQLRQPADLRLVVSSIQVVAEGHGWERWGNFPRERRRLYDLIRDTGANGVIFLSGDRHIGALYRDGSGAPYPMIDLTSSGLNLAFPGNRESGPNRIGGVYGAVNFGTVDIDWWEESVTLALRSLNGEPVRKLTVRFEELKVAR